MKELELIGRVGYESGLARCGVNGEKLEDEVLRGKEMLITSHLLEEQKRRINEMKLDPRKISYSMKLDPNVVFGCQNNSQ